MTSSGHTYVAALYTAPDTGKLPLEDPKAERFRFKDKVLEHRCSFWLKKRRDEKLNGSGGRTARVLGCGESCWWHATLSPCFTRLGTTVGPQDKTRRWLL